MSSQSQRSQIIEAICEKIQPMIQMQTSKARKGKELKSATSALEIGS
jgi:hypothetical protein